MPRGCAESGRNPRFPPPTDKENGNFQDLPRVVFKSGEMGVKKKMERSPLSDTEAQAALRKNIATTKKLVKEAEYLIETSRKVVKPLPITPAKDATHC
jgi:hypothetical protein